jgi:hypothetical protein
MATQQGGLAVSRLDGRGFSLRAFPPGAVRSSRVFAYGTPGPAPRIRPRLADCSQSTRPSWVRRIVKGGTLFPRSDAPHAATLARITFCGLSPALSGSLVAGRRLLPCPRLIASHGSLSLFRSRALYQEPFLHVLGRFPGYYCINPTYTNQFLAESSTSHNPEFMVADINTSGQVFTI